MSHTPESNFVRPTSCKVIPKHLYDVNKLFPPGVGQCSTKQGPDLNLPKETKDWLSKSAFTVSVVGLLSKFWTNIANSLLIHNKSNLINALENRPKGVPLITVTNHHSCMDEPLLWGILDVRHLVNQCLMRWALAAHNICFWSNPISKFFAYGKSIPVNRGAGVYQEGVNFAIDRLNEGHWVHLYPEGQVNENKIDMRYKWGVGRLIAESHVDPIVIPIYHVGMDDILPNTRPYFWFSRFPKVGKKVTVLIGEPIPVKDTLKELRNNSASEEVMRKTLTDLIEKHLKELRINTEIYHAKRTTKFA